MDVSHLSRYRYSSLYPTHGVIYNTRERDRIRALPVIHTATEYLALHRFDDDRDNERYAADAQRYPWLFDTDAQQTAA